MHRETSPKAGGSESLFLGCSFHTATGWLGLEKSPGCHLVQPMLKQGQLPRTTFRCHSNITKEGDHKLWAHPAPVLRHPHGKKTFDPPVFQFVPPVLTLGTAAKSLPLPLHPPFLHLYTLRSLLSLLFSRLQSTMSLGLWSLRSRGWSGMGQTERHGLRLGTQSDHRLPAFHKEEFSPHSIPVPSLCLYSLKSYGRKESALVVW